MTDVAPAYPDAPAGRRRSGTGTGGSPVSICEAAVVAALILAAWGCEEYRYWSRPRD
jgi:hypothetical protein